MIQRITTHANFSRPAVLERAAREVLFPRDGSEEAKDGNIIIVPNIEKRPPQLRQ